MSPLMKNETIPPKPVICFFASSSCGNDSRPEDEKSYALLTQRQCVNKLYLVNETQWPECHMQLF